MNHFVDVKDIPALQLPEAERAVHASIVRLSQQAGVDKTREAVMERLRGRLDEIRVRLGHTVSPSGRLLSPEAEQRPSAPTLIANPNAALGFGDDLQAGVALRVDF